MRTTMAAIAANRFGLGATPGQLEEIASDPQGWLLEQLDRDSATPAPIASLPSTTEDLTAFGRLRRKAQRSGPQQGKTAGGARKTFRSELLPRYLTAAKARFDTAVESKQPFRERLVHFWSNHFVVSGAKPAAIAMPPSFEKDVARKHVCGHFESMLLASCRHPAMTFYLDNYLSIGPGSRWGRRPEELPPVPANVGKPSGLNENLAREVLELHTLGVNGGYTQVDVTSLARVLTGWNTIASRRQRLRSYLSGDLFHFSAAAHEPGSQTVLDQRYSQNGVAQGEAVLRDLAAHPSTAAHLARKLAAHFVADEPPPSVVEAVSKALLRHDGDLREGYRALVQAPDAWNEAPTKLKRPEEYLISTARALGGDLMDSRQLGRTLSELGQRTWMSPGPDGWPDDAAAWLGPDQLWKRLEWATLVAEHRAPELPAPTTLAGQVLGERLCAATRRELARAESPAQGLTLLLVSPDFQRR